MDCGSALDALRSRLEATFGKALAMMIIASASNEAGCSTVSITPPEFQRLAEAVATDSRVVDMWGAAGAADALSSWRQLVA